MKSILVLLFVFVSTFVNGQSVDSIKQLIKIARHDSIRARLYIEVTESIEREQIDTIERYCELAINIDEKQLTTSLNKNERLFYLKNLSISFNNLGYVHYARKNKIEALNFYRKGIVLQEQIGDTILLGNSYVNLAHLYEECFDTLHAFEAYNKSLIYSKYNTDKTVYIENLYGIAFLHSGNKNYEEAEKYFKKVLTTSVTPNQKESIHYAVINLGNIYAMKGDTAKAMEFLTKALQLSIKADDRISIANTCNDLGGIYRNQNNFKEAEINFKRSIQILDSLEDYRSLAAVLRNYSKLHLRKKDLKQALSYALKSMDKAKITNNRIEIKYSAELLCEIYNLTSSELALDYCNLYNFIEDSLQKIKTEDLLFSKIFKKNYDAFDVNFINKYNLEDSPKNNSNFKFYLIGFSILIVVLILFFKFRRNL